MENELERRLLETNRDRIRNPIIRGLSDEVRGKLYGARVDWSDTRYTDAHHPDWLQKGRSKMPTEKYS